MGAQQEVEYNNNKRDNNKRDNGSQSLEGEEELNRQGDTNPDAGDWQDLKNYLFYPKTQPNPEQQPTEEEEEEQPTQEEQQPTEEEEEPMN